MRGANCGVENRNRAKFCVECTSPFALRCWSCNAEHLPTAEFCLECAKPIEVEIGLAPQRAAGLRQDRDGERRHVTVLFSDRVNSTELASRLDPEDWRDIAAEYQSAMTRAPSLCC